MILFKLRCGAEHEFEAWFRDGAAYERQAAQGEIACPTCGDSAIGKAPMAPRLGRTGGENKPPSPEEMRRVLQQVRRHVEANCDYVGPRFAEEARRIHRGDADARGIYGEASETESRELADEGIEVARIPWVPTNDA